MREHFVAMDIGLVTIEYVNVALRGETSLDVLG